MKPEDRKRLKQHIEMIVEHKEPDVIAQENFKKLQDEVTDLREKNIKLRLELQTLRFKESQENRFVWWVYQVYARNVLDLVQSVPVMCPCDTEEDVPFIELAARIKEYTEHIYDGTYLDTAMSTEQSNSDVSMTQDVLIDIKTPQSVENNNPDYYKDELYLDEDFRMLAKTYPADVSAIGVTTLIDYVEALEADLARLTAIIARLKEDGERLATRAVYWDEYGKEYECIHLECGGHSENILFDHSPYCPITLHRALMKELE